MYGTWEYRKNGLGGVTSKAEYKLAGGRKWGGVEASRVGDRHKVRL